MDEQILSGKNLKTPKEGLQWNTICHRILQCCLRKHSKRSDTNQVCHSIILIKIIHFG